MAHVVDALDAPSSCERPIPSYAVLLLTLYLSDRDSRSSQSKWEQEAMLETTATLYIGQSKGDA